MADMVQANKEVILLHRHPSDRIKETNAAFTYLRDKVDVGTFKSFPRTGGISKFWKSILWIFYAPFLVKKHHKIVYCDDSYPFYPILIGIFYPEKRLVLRLGDFHLMYNYSGIVYWFLHEIEKIGWSLADEILVISQAMRDKLLDEGFVCKVIFDPVDPNDFPISPAPSAEDVIMFHGQLTKNKGIDLLIEAARRMPECRFVIVGDGPDRNRLHDIAPTNVFFNSWVEFKDMHICINFCTMGVAMRNKNRGNEYVVTSPFLQYGVMGKPCLVSKRKVFRNYAWQFSNVDEFVEKARKLLKLPEEGKRLQEYVLRQHHAKRIAEQIWQVLTSQL